MIAKIYDEQNNKMLNKAGSSNEYGLKNKREWNYLA